MISANSLSIYTSEDNGEKVIEIYHVPTKTYVKFKESEVKHKNLNHANNIVQGYLKILEYKIELANSQIITEVVLEKIDD